MNQLGLFDPEPEARGEDTGKLHDCPRPSDWFWRGFIGSCHGWTLRVYSRGTEGECIRACRALIAEDEYGYLCGYRVERIDYPAY